MVIDFFHLTNVCCWHTCYVSRLLHLLSRLKTYIAIYCHYSTAIFLKERTEPGNPKERKKNYNTNPLLINIISHGTSLFYVIYNINISKNKW